MSTNGPSAPPSIYPLSLHGLFSGFFFNHVDHSRATAPDPYTPPFGEGVEHEGVTIHSKAVALAFGTQVDDFKPFESTADITAMSSPPRRGMTLPSSLAKSDPSVPNAAHPHPFSDTPIPSVQSTFGIISLTASGGSGSSSSDASGSGLMSLCRSLSDIFSPDETILSPKDRSTSLISIDGSSSLSGLDLDPPTPEQLSRIRLSLPTLPGAEPSSPTSPQSSIRRQMTLPAVIEGETTSEFKSIQKIETQMAEKRLKPVNINHNITASEESKSSSTTPQRILTRSQSLGGECQTAPVDLAQPEAMKVPEVRPRKFGILELFAAGERRSVRNRDINALAPQSF